MKRFAECIIKSWPALCIVIALVSAAALYYLPALTIQEDESTWFSADDPILLAYHEFQEVFVAGETAVIAFCPQDPLGADALRYLDELCKKLQSIPQVTDVISLTTVDDIQGTEDGLEIRPLVVKTPRFGRTPDEVKERIAANPFFSSVLYAEKNGTLGIVVQFTGTDDEKDKPGDHSRNITDAVTTLLHKETAETGLRYYLGGNIITDAAVAAMVEHDMYRFYPASLLLAGLLLLLIFRNLASVFFPLLSVSLALLWTLGLMGITGAPITPVSTTLFALITVIGIANAVHLISHFTVALHRHADKREALRETFERAGTACFFTSLTTSFGFGSLCVSELPVIREMGLFAAFGIMCAFGITVVLVSAGMLCRRVAPSPVAPPIRLNHQNLLRRIAGINRAHPHIVLAAGAAVVAGMAWGIPKIEVESSLIEYLKKGSSLRKDAEFIDSALAGISSVEVVIMGPEDAFKDPSCLRRIDSLQQRIVAHPKVAAALSMVDYLKLIYRALNSDSAHYYRIPETREAAAQSLLLYEMAGGTAIEDYVTTSYDRARVSIHTRQMSQKERAALLEEVELFMKNNFGDMRFEVTGFDNLVYRTTERVVTTQIQSISLAVGVIALVMIVIFGIKGGLISIIPNIFPVVFLFGLMGYGGYKLDIATAIIASIAIGIVVDDTIHYFFHFKHELKGAATREEAMIRAHASVGGALCYTTCILATGFLIFLWSDTRILFHYGLLSCIAVSVALLGDLFIGPTLLVTLKIFKEK